MEPIHIELQNLLKAFLSKNPDSERRLADELNVSLTTIKLWKTGKNLPHPIIAETIVKKLRAG